MSAKHMAPRDKSRSIGGGKATSVFAVILFIALAACAKIFFGDSPAVAPSKAIAASEEERPAAPPAALVVYREAMRADLASSREYVGEVEAVQFVDIRPQVSGAIDEVHFAEGSVVKEGAPLFTIDTREYKATVDLRRAELSIAKANYDYAAKYHSRLKAADKRSVSAADVDAAAARAAQTKAAVDQANASLRLAQITLDRCTIKSPITGQIGRAAFTKGNYVSPGSEPLASIAQVDPVRVKFSIPDRDFLENAALLREPGADIFDAKLYMPDGSEYQEAGVRDFEDNVMDPHSGTITMRMRFANHQSVLIPGTVVRISLKPKKAHIGCVVPQIAILADAEGDFVYVVDKESKAERRSVSIGGDFGSMTEILSGVEPGERVIIRGLQRIRPGAAVDAHPEKPEGEEPSPAERAMDSMYDLEPVSSEAK